MNSTLMISRTSTQDTPRERLYIDGIAVSDLFEQVHGDTRDIADSFGKRVRFDVIAWSSLTVAADAETLASSLVNAVRWCLASTDTHGITIRAYPCHDDVWTVFDVQADLYADQQQPAEMWKPTLGSLRSSVQRMGGEWEPVASYPDCRRITFRLPQWISADADISKPARRAS